MTPRYSSSLIRCWHLASGTQRIVVEHIQSGEQTAVPTLDAAAAWIEGQEGELTPAQRPDREIVTEES